MRDRTDISEPEAADLLGVSAVTLRRWRQQGTIGFHRYPGGRVRYDLDQLADFRARCRIDPVA